MKQIKVTNQGRRERSRIGILLKPGEELETSVTPRDYLVLKAVKDFAVEVLEEAEPQENTAEPQKEEAEPDDQMADEQVKELQESNRDDFLAYVEENGIDPQTAIDIENDGQGRKSVLEKLEAKKDE